MGVRSEFLFRVQFDVAEVREVGRGPLGLRRIARVSGGSFEGPRLRGVCLPNPGGDWLLFADDGSTRLDVRVILKTDDDAIIYMSYSGVRHGPPEIMARLAAGEVVDPSLVYFRMAPRFETGAEKYDWLNAIIAVGTGERLPTGPVYHVHQVL